MYMTDENLPQYGNFFEADRRPFMYAGETEAADGGDPQIDGTNGGLSLKGGTYFKTDEIEIGDSEGNELLEVFSVFLRVKFYALPTSGEEIVLKMTGTKIITLTIKDDGYLVLKSGATILHNYSGDQITADGSWNFIVVTIGRVKLTPSYFDSFCMIEVQNHAGEAEGGSFTCKLGSN
jgi:hypothetical protein